MTTPSADPGRQGGAQAAGGKKKKPWWLLALLAVLAIIALVLLLSRCGGGDDNATGAAPTGVAAPTGAAASDPSADPSAAPSASTETSATPSSAAGSSTEPPAGSTTEATPGADTAPGVSTAPSAPAGSGSPTGGPLTAGTVALLPLTAAAPEGTLTAYVDQPATSTGVTVQSVPADEGFWVGTSTTDRVWVQLVGEGESPYQVRAGDTVTFTGTVVGHPTDYPATMGLSTADGADQLSTQAAHIEVAQDGLTPVS